MGKKYAAIARKSKLEDVVVSARGSDLADVETNLRTAVELYPEDAKANPDTVVMLIPTYELIEFLHDTEPEWYKESKKGSADDHGGSRYCFFSACNTS